MCMIMATHEYKGKWWLPGKEDDKVSGVLSYTPGESIELELIGNFSESDQNVINNLFVEERVPVIYGQASDGSDISLFDCGNSIHRVFKADFSITKYFPRYIAIGMLLPSINEKRFFKAKIKIPELSFWLYPKAIERLFLTDNDRISGVNIRMDNLPEEERVAAKTRLRNGYSCSLTREANYNSGDLLFTASFEQFTALVIESNKETSFKALYEKTVRFERFLSLATLRDVSSSEILLFSKDSFKEIGGRPHYSPIRIDTVFHDSPNQKKISVSDFLFNHDTIKEKYNDIIRKWFSRDSQFDAIRGHMLESIDYQGHFSYINFLVVIQAIEGYGLRYRKTDVKNVAKARIAKAQKEGKPIGSKDITLADILSTLINDYRDVTCVNKRINKRAIIDTRHYYSHLTEKKKKHKVDGVKLFDLTYHLRKLLLCCVLSYLGFTNAEIEQYTKDCNSAIIRGYK